MKQQLLESREVLIGHLEEQLNFLKKQRNQLLTQKGKTEKQQPGQRVNISDYLHKQNGKGKQITHNRSIPQPKQQNFMIKQPEQVKSKGQIIRQKQENQQKLIKLQELYKKKRQLESIGIYQNNSGKISSMYNNKDMRKKIMKKVEENKKNASAKIQKDKIIQEQLFKAESFLKESKKIKQKKKEVPKNHYSKVFEDKSILQNVDNLINKSQLTIVEKEKLLQYVYSTLKQTKNQLQKEQLRVFLLSNIEFCEKFNITKPEIQRDLKVYQTECEGYLTYQEFYQFIKSIQITNKTLHPNMNRKLKEKQFNSKQNMPQKTNTQLQIRREMEKYLKNVFNYFDTKHERVIERQKFEIALKKGLLHDQRKYKLLKKNQIVYFGEFLHKSKKKISKLDYFKTLDLKYIGLEEIFEHYSKSNEKQEEKLTQNNQSQSQGKSQLQDVQNEQSLVEEDKEEREVQPPLKQELESQDFQKYGWEKEINEEQFDNLKQMDKYYGEVRKKYGNEIHWNGIQHYHEDWNKFNKVIKQMSKQ